MNKGETTRYYAKIKALAIYQILGGLTGIGINLWSIQLSMLSFASQLIVSLITILYCFSIYCAYLLFKKQAKALLLSKINQLLQTVCFFLFGFSYQFFSGVYLTAGIDLTNDITFRFNTGISQWSIYINSDQPYQVVQLNLVALFLIIVIDRLQKKKAEMEADKQVAEILSEETIAID